MMANNRGWMYNRLLSDRTLSAEYLDGVENFLEYAFGRIENVRLDRGVQCIRCPCDSCHNVRFQNREEVARHLVNKGFVSDYTTWHWHGESIPADDMRPSARDEDSCDMDQMVFDAAGPNFNWDAEAPNVEAKTFFDMLHAADELLWDGPGCSRENLLSAVTLLLSLKSEFDTSQACFNRMVFIIREKLLPENNRLPSNYYESKKMIKGLGMGYEKYDVCQNNCMLYYGENAAKVVCDICEKPRFNEIKEGTTQKPIPYKVMRYLPITPRLQRLFMSPQTSKHMMWHKNGIRDKPNMIIHPADGESWKHFDATYPEFASEPRNVRLALSTDGFAPFSMSASRYSCWPVFVAPYNLPPGMTFKDQNIFLSVVIPGPEHPGRNLNIFLKPLIDELNILWEKGAYTFDSHRRENFTMRAALFWTIHDFPAYGMVSGWSTHGRLACPICMEHTKSFYLPNGRKHSWFDWHGIWMVHSWSGRTCQSTAACSRGGRWVTQDEMDKMHEQQEKDRAGNRVVT